MLTHQQVVDFVIDVYESGIYRTHSLGGFLITRDPLGWSLYVEP